MLGSRKEAFVKVKLDYGLDVNDNDRLAKITTPVQKYYYSLTLSRTFTDMFSGAKKVFLANVKKPFFPWCNCLFLGCKDFFLQYK